MNPAASPSALPHSPHSASSSPASPIRYAPIAEWWRAFLADRTLRGVFLITVCIWGGWMACLARSGALPWADEYAFVIAGIATGEKPVTWQFLWEPSNEHRAPLNRLWGVILGRVCNWDFRRMQKVQVTLLTVGCLALVLAVRQVRGRAHLADVFLPLVLLTPAHFETLGNYAVAYAMPLAIWCLVAAAAMVKVQTRSLAGLVLYLLGALVVAWAGGPAGNLWALGFCIPLAQGWVGAIGRVWKICAVLGGFSIVASSALLLHSTPPSICGLDAYHSTSLAMTCQAAIRLAVGWLGGPPLRVLYPWILVPVGIALLCLFARFLKDMRRTPLAALVRWSDLTGLLVSALLVAGAIAYGRGKNTDLWASRYCALEVPIAVATYLLLVRAAVSRTLLSALALGVACCFGWNFPAVVATTDYLHPREALLRTELRAGREPLCVLAEKYPDASGWAREWGLQHLIGWWHRLRQAHVSVFHGDHRTAERCLYWHAQTGSLGQQVGVVWDDQAADFGSVEALNSGPGMTAVYEVDVPAEGVYRLCCRCRAPTPGPGFGLAFDEGPTEILPVAAGTRYKAVVSAGRHLAAGKHRVTITWPGPGSRMDLLELTPQ